jgi:integrase
MSEQALVDITGRLRSPAATPGHWAGCAPPNKGLRYPADPPTVEEIILVMRQAGPGPYADRTRGLIAILWRAGLRISEALALTETDLDARTGSVLVRSGKGGQRRMVGMDDWAWEHVARWTEHRIKLPVGPLFCVLAGPTRGRGWSATAARGELRRLAAEAGVRRRFAPHQLRHAHAIEMAHEGIPLPIIQRQLGHAHRRDHVDLPPRYRYTRDRRHGPPPPATGDPGECRPAAITRTRGARGRRIARPLFIAGLRSATAPRASATDVVRHQQAQGRPSGPLQG